MCFHIICISRAEYFWGFCSPSFWRMPNDYTKNLQNFCYYFQEEFSFLLNLPFMALRLYIIFYVLVLSKFSLLCRYFSDIFSTFLCNSCMDLRLCSRQSSNYRLSSQFFLRISRHNFLQCLNQLISARKPSPPAPSFSATRCRLELAFVRVLHLDSTVDTLADTFLHLCFDLVAFFADLLADLLMTIFWVLGLWYCGVTDLLLHSLPVGNSWVLPVFMFSYLLSWAPFIQIEQFSFSHAGSCLRADVPDELPSSSEYRFNFSFKYFLPEESSSLNWQYLQCAYFLVEVSSTSLVLFGGGKFEVQFSMDRLLRCSKPWCCLQIAFIFNGGILNN